MSSHGVSRDPKRWGLDLNARYGILLDLVIAEVLMPESNIAFGQLLPGGGAVKKYQFCKPSMTSLTDLEAG